MTTPKDIPDKVKIQLTFTRSAMSFVVWEHLQSLFVRYQRNDQDVVRELYNGLQQNISGLLRTKRVSENTLDELCQDILLKIHLNREQYNPTLPLKPWVTTIARRTVIDHWRCYAKTTFVPFEDSEATSDRWIESQPEAFMRIRDLLRSIGVLKSTDRAIIDQFAFEDKSIEEIASELQISVAAVKVRLHRARKALRDLSMLMLIVILKGRL